MQVIKTVALQAANNTGQRNSVNKLHGFICGI